VYIDGRFLAGGGGSQQRQVADGADVVFTDTRCRCPDTSAPRHFSTDAIGPKYPDTFTTTDSENNEHD